MALMVHQYNDLKCESLHQELVKRTIRQIKRAWSLFHNLIQSK